MIRLAVFDLDGTLAPLGKGISPKDIRLLKEIEQKGVRIALCSGKPCYYLCGLMRQVELRDPILIGENGATVVFGVDLPPREHYVLPYSEAAKRSLSFLKDKIDESIPDMWYQPNEVALTPFPKNEEQFDTVQRLLDENQAMLSDITVYRHGDSFDIVPCGIDKKRGLAFLAGLIGISAEETLAVGDGVNDYPMLDYAHLAIGINLTQGVHRSFSNCTDALRYILQIVSGE